MANHFVLTPQAIMEFAGGAVGGKLGFRAHVRHLAPRIKIAGVNPLKGTAAVLEWYQTGNPRPAQTVVMRSRARTQGGEWLLLETRSPAKSERVLDAGQARVTSRPF